MTYKVVYTRRAKKDAPLLKAAHLEKKAKELIAIIEENPYAAPPRYEQLSGDMQGLISRRINLQHRLVYQVLEAEKTVKVISMWLHYE